jgi:uncharacterized membrane protein YqjE
VFVLITKWEIDGDTDVELIHTYLSITNFNINSERSSSLENMFIRMLGVTLSLYLRCLAVFLAACFSDTFCANTETYSQNRALTML